MKNENRAQRFAIVRANGKNRMTSSILCVIKAKYKDHKFPYFDGTENFKTLAEETILLNLPPNGPIIMDNHNIVTCYLVTRQ
jgi:hypothetical protein